MTLWQSIVFFLPLFLVINLVSAVPGRDDLRTALRVGVRHFVTGTVILVVACVALQLLMDWLIGRPPLW